MMGLSQNGQPLSHLFNNGFFRPQGIYDHLQLIALWKSTNFCIFSLKEGPHSKEGLTLRGSSLLGGL